MKTTTQQINGTSWHGTTFMASRKTLLDLIGEPHGLGDVNEKVQYEWLLETDDGTVFTLYDWKEYREFAEHETIEWHIGGHNLEDTVAAKGEIRQALSAIRP